LSLVRHNKYMSNYKDLDTVTETDDYLECDDCGVPHDDGQLFTFIKPYDFEPGHWVCIGCKEELFR